MDQHVEERDRSAGVGGNLEDRAVTVEQWRGIRGSDAHPDGSPPTLHLQDNRLRCELETGERRHLPDDHPLSYTEGGRGEPEQGGNNLPPAPVMGSSIPPMTAATGPNWQRVPGAAPVTVQKQFTTSPSRLTAAACMCSTKRHHTARAGDTHHRCRRACFAPRSTYRWSQRSRALINYSLERRTAGPLRCSTETERPRHRDLRSTPHAGLNRTAWDLRYEPPRLIAMQKRRRPRIRTSENFSVFADRIRGRWRLQLGTRPGAGRRWWSPEGSP